MQFGQNLLASNRDISTERVSVNDHCTHQTNSALGNDIRYRVSQLNTDDGIGTGNSHHREHINNGVAVIVKKIENNVSKLSNG